MRGERVALVVERTDGQQQIYVKPVPELLAREALARRASRSWATVAPYSSSDLNQHGYDARINFPKPRSIDSVELAHVGASWAATALAQLVDATILTRVPIVPTVPDRFRVRSRLDDGESSATSRVRMAGSVGIFLTGRGQGAHH